MAVPLSASRVSTSSYFSDFGFDPHMDYAQVLEEARKQKFSNSSIPRGCTDNFQQHSRRARRADLVVDISCFSAHFKAAELQKSLEHLKARRSWKHSLFFWKKSHMKHKVPYSGIPTPQHQGFKSRSKPTSGPIYSTMDVHDISLSCRSSRSNSGSLSATLTPTRKGEVEIPYVSLYQRNHSRDPHTTPVYLVT